MTITDLSWLIPRQPRRAPRAIQPRWGDGRRWGDHAASWGTAAGAIELQSNIALRATPTAVEHVINKGYVDNRAARYTPIQPPDPVIGSLWATPNAELFVWTGAEWLTLLGAGPVPPPASWGLGGIRWGGGQRWA